MISWNEEIVDAIARRRCVIFIGSGVSKNSSNTNGKRPATWDEFLRSAAEQLENPPNILSLIDKKDYLTACDVIKQKLGLERFRQLVQREYQQGAYNHAPIHQHIYNLDSSIVASPNFDNIYDTYAQHVSNGSVIVKDHSSQDTINYVCGGEYRLLLKTHGSANTPGDVIFTRSDYAEARVKHRVFYELLKSLVLTHRFLFLGCGMDDPDIRLLFEDVRFAHSSMPTHFMTIPGDEFDADLAHVVGASMKLQFIPYSVENHHQELTDSLADLVALVEKKREQLAISQSW